MSLSGDVAKRAEKVSTRRDESWISSGVPLGLSWNHSCCLWKPSVRFVLSSLPKSPKISRLLASPCFGGAFSVVSIRPRAPSGLHQMLLSTLACHADFSKAPLEPQTKITQVFGISRFGEPLLPPGSNRGRSGKRHVTSHILGELLVLAIDMTKELPKTATLCDPGRTRATDLSLTCRQRLPTIERSSEASLLSTGCLV